MWCYNSLQECRGRCSAKCNISAQIGYTWVVTSSQLLLPLFTHFMTIHVWLVSFTNGFPAVVIQPLRSHLAHRCSITSHVCEVRFLSIDTSLTPNWITYSFNSLFLLAGDCENVYSFLIISYSGTFLCSAATSKYHSGYRLEKPVLAISLFFTLSVVFFFYR